VNEFNDVHSAGAWSRRLPMVTDPCPSCKPAAAAGRRPPL